MELLLAVLIIITLIFIRKNNTVALVFTILTALIYIKSVPYVHLFLLVTSIRSISSYYTLFLCLIYIVLMITSVVFVYRKKYKVAIWTLWITFTLLLLHNWNIWFDLIIRLF